MTLESRFRGDRPLSRPMSNAFLGWASQIQFEVYHALVGRDAQWLNAVAEQIRAVLAPQPGKEKDWQELLLGPNPSRPARAPFPFLVDDLGQLGLFAAREPRHDWHPMSPQTEQWERYAVFAAMAILAAFERIDAADESGDAKKLLDEAGGLAIEAARALQIAHSLNIDALARSEKGKGAANARYMDRPARLDLAIAIASSRQFESKKAAAVAVVDGLPKDNMGAPYDVETVLKWFKERKFVPPLIPRLSTKRSYKK